MPGAFYKVRAQGSASERDVQELSKISKRGFVSGFMAGVHSYILVQFLYNSRLFTRATTPHLVFEFAPYVIYPAGLLFVAYKVYSEHRRTVERLDSKYTPIWVRITMHTQTKA